MSKIDDLRGIELELLSEFIRVCGREGLRWYASHGTLLGALRGGGFLLWDDDIDVAMPAEDYDRLARHKEWFGGPYTLQTPSERGRCHKLRLCRNGTAAFYMPLYEHLRRGGHLGICIDILPLDEIGDTGFYCLPSGHTVPVSYYEPCAKAPFEHLTVNIPARAGKVLDLIYGYWQWPGDAQFPGPPHYWFFDTQKDYTVYVKRYTGWVKAARENDIYLFGAADSLRIWLEDFGLRDRVVCVFDNDSGKWGGECCGIEVRGPSGIPDALGGNSIIIITSLWHLEIGRQLEAMGINDYYVFLDKLFVSEFKGI